MDTITVRSAAATQPPPPPTRPSTPRRRRPPRPDTPRSVSRRRGNAGSCSTHPRSQSPGLATTYARLGPGFRPVLCVLLRAAVRAQMRPAMRQGHTAPSMNHIVLLFYWSHGHAHALLNMAFSYATPCSPGLHPGTRLVTTAVHGVILTWA